MATPRWLSAKVVAVVLACATLATGAPAVAGECLAGAAASDCRPLSATGDGDDFDTVELLQRSQSPYQAKAGAEGNVAAAFVAEAEPSTTATPTDFTTLPPTGITVNSHDDFSAFITALVTNTCTFVVCVVLFSFLRQRYPLMYSFNAMAGQAPTTPSHTALGWLSASLDADMDGIVEHTGLDQAMLIEFSHLAMKIILLIGFPMIFVFGPMNYFFGGNTKKDSVSYLSLGNVENGSWMYWMYAFVVWFVVLVVQSNVYKAQGKFLERRFKWLRSMPHLRANTVLVEGIPEEFRSDERLAEFFESVLPGDGNVERAYVVKDVSELMPAYVELEECRRCLAEAQAIWEANGRSADDRPTVRINWGSKVDSIQHYAQKIADLEPLVATLKERIVKASAAEIGGVNLSVGFVTFSARVEAEIALRLDGIASDSEQWRISTPPAPADIQWGDFMQDDTAERARYFVGYLCVAGLYFAYMPLVVGVTNLAKLIDMGPLQPLWQGLAPTLGLQFMVAFLPTFIILIFEIFFTLKAAQWAQLHLQTYYFWFQVVFVLLAASVGQNVREFTQTVVQNPFQSLSVMAESMPSATHFYWNFLVLQWATHGMNLTRYVPLIKFFIFKRIYDEETARAMSEPEDQDYYGIGSRSARWTMNLSIAIVFGTLSPPMWFFALVNFAICRLVYGYLMPYAETKKTDLGGAFWVQQLNHVFVGNVIYCMLMTGVLFNRSDSLGPGLIAAPSILYVLWSLKRFQTAFSWENLPFQELMQDVVTATKKRSIVGAYVQPQLADTRLAATNLGKVPPPAS